MINAKLLRLFLIFCLAALLLPLGGCQLLGVVPVLTGPADTPAEYVPPQEPMLVLVETYIDGASSMDSTDIQMGRYLIDLLREHKVAPVLDADRLLHYTATTVDAEAFSHKTVDAVGRELDAKQVLYVNVTSSQVEQATGSEVMRGHMSAKVRLVDAVTGQNAWPADSQSGRLVSIDTEWRHDTGADAQAKLQLEISALMADKVSKLFYKYQSDTEALPDE